MLKVLTVMFGSAALTFFASAGIIAASGDLRGCLGPLIAGAIFGTPALFIAIVAYKDN